MTNEPTHFEVLPARTLPEDVLTRSEVDLALVWLDASPFQDFECSDPDAANAQDALLLVTFELLPGHDEAALDALLGPNDLVHDTWRGQGGVFGTARLSKATCARWLEAAGRDIVARFEVALVWRDQRPGPRQHRAWPRPGFSDAVMGSMTSPGSAGDVPPATNDLWIVVDDGCPWARSDLRLPSGGSRLRSLWYQRAHGARIADDEALPHPWGGLQWSTHGLDAWLRRVGGDPTTAYAQWGDPHLQRRTSHGAHVLGLLFDSSGQPLPSTAPSATTLSVNANASAAALTPHRDEPTGPDLVFVQLPEHVRSTVSRAALTPWVLEGLAHGLRFAEDAQRVVATLSLESYDGPHDGSSLFEAGVQALIEHARLQQQVQLRVVLAAGNAHQRQVAAVLDLVPGVSGEFCWEVPPGSERAAWLELWCPAQQPLPDIQVAAPGLAPSPSLDAGRLWTWPSRQTACCAVMIPSAPRTGGRLVWIRLAPTQVFQPGEPAAPCGVWRIRLRSEQPLRVHAYLARVWAGEDGRPSGRQGRLWLEPASAGDLQRAHPSATGTISGLACGGPAVTVVGGTWAADTASENLAEEAPAVPYSGQGPARAGWRSQAPAVDALAPSEHSHAWRGVRSRGHLDGSAPHMGGTSMAVPQHARRLSDTESQETPPS